jgi:hypothetical protein
MPITVHYRMPCKGEGVTFTTWEYMFLFKGGERQLTKVETTLKNNYGFSIVVVKYCEVFICPTCK